MYAHGQHINVLKHIVMLKMDAGADADWGCCHPQP